MTEYYDISSMDQCTEFICSQAHAIDQYFDEYPDDRKEMLPYILKIYITYEYLYKKCKLTQLNDFKTSTTNKITKSQEIKLSNNSINKDINTQNKINIILQKLMMD
jgi:hypothetical protein